MDKRARVFNIMQYEYHPIEGYASQNSDEPKSGAEPLITEAAIGNGLNHRSITRWAYVWHDQDSYAKDNEAKGVKAGDHKHRHVHIVLQCKSNIDVSSVAS